MMWFIILLVLIGLIVYVFLHAYNTLQRKAQEIRESLSNISVTMSKKVGLINQLVDVVKNYQDSENLVHLTAVKETGVSAVQSTLKDTNMMMATMQSMADRYPNLKADQQYHRLIDNIEGLEDELAQFRKNYNSKVKDYNTSRASIPTIFVANALGFTNAPYLDMSLENDATILNEFKTDDGARLNALLSTAKNNIVDSSRSIAQSSKGAIDKATNAHKKPAAQKSSDEKAMYFYMLPSAAPKGPVTEEDLILLSEDGDWCDTVKINQTSTEAWLTYDEWLAKNTIVETEIDNTPTSESDAITENKIPDEVAESDEPNLNIDASDKAS